MFVVLALTVGGFLLVIGLRLTAQHAMMAAVRRLRATATNRLADRRRALVTSGSLEKWLTGYYSERGASASLPTIRHNSKVRTLPLYAPKAWRWGPDVSPLKLGDFEAVLSSGNLVHRDANEQPPDAVRARGKALGRAIWNGDAMEILALPDHYQSSVRARNVGYFHIAEPMIRLEDEAATCAPSRWRRPKIRDGRPCPPLATVTGLGGTAVVVYDSDEGARLLIHRRSRDVATNPGLWCTIPTFIVEDPTASGRERTSYDLTVWNVLREVLEEVFDIDEVTRAHRRTNADWFFDEVSFASELAAQYQSGAVQLFHLGWSLNLLNGLLDSMTLVYVRGDRNLYEKLFKNVKGSKLEVDDRDGSILWLPLDSSTLRDLMVEPTFHAGSALAIDVVLELLPVIRRR